MWHRQKKCLYWDNMKAHLSASWDKVRWPSLDLVPMPHPSVTDQWSPDWGTCVHLYLFITYTISSQDPKICATLVTTINIIKGKCDDIKGMCLSFCNRQTDKCPSAEINWLCRDVIFFSTFEFWLANQFYSSMNALLSAMIQYESNSDYIITKAFNLDIVLHFCIHAHDQYW